MRFLLVALLLLFTPLHAKEKYYLSICAIFRNEARFLKEWIEFHRMVGVEHFYLINNLSEDAYDEVLKPYIREGIVELTHCPYNAQNHKDWNTIQCGAYNAVVKKKKDETFWLAIIDTDEFIIPLEKKMLPKFLKGYEKYGGLGINWQLYGTSEIYRIPDHTLLVETLTKKAPKNYSKNRFVKTIFQPKKITEVKQPHHCKYKKGYYHVTENKEPFPENKSLTPVVSINKVRINHYTTRDEAFFYCEKQRRINQWFPGGTPPVPDPELSTIEDKVMFSYVEELRSRVFSPYHISTH